MSRVMPNAEYRIELKDPTMQPIMMKPYNLSMSDENELNRQIDELVNHGLMEHCDSNWGSPAFLINKTDGSKRLISDFSNLNQYIKPDNFYISNLNELFKKLNGSKYFTSLDIVSGYHHVRASEYTKDLLAIVTKKYHVRWTVMPFGPSNAPSQFRRAMIKIFGDIPYVKIFFDDILIHSPDLKTHLKHLEDVFQIMQRANVRINYKKCTIAAKEIKYLGFTINENGIKPTEGYIEKVLKIPEPTNVTELKRLIGLVNFPGMCIPNLQLILKPLHELTKKNVPFIIERKAQKGYSNSQRCDV